MIDDYTARQDTLGQMLIAGLITGCTNVWVLRDDGSSTTQMRIEAEHITDAILVREDTAPRWQFGRFAFDPEPDRLLVVSRITPIGKKIEEEPDNEHADFDPKDLILDRVWITVPLETTVRQALNIE